MDKTDTPPSQQPIRRQKIQQRIVRSNVTHKGMMGGDPFFMGGSNPVETQVSFASEAGRRGQEVLGLGTGPAATTIVNSTVARRRSRHAVLTNSYAKRAIDILTSNVVGSGHKMVSMCSNPEFKKQVEKLWKKSCEEFDPAGKLNFAAIEALIFRSMCEGGDSFVRMRVRKASDGLAVPLQLQLFESEQVPVNKNETIGKNSIIAGIEFNPIGKIVNYHMYKNHPGDFNLSITNQVSAGQTFAIPASDVIHLHDVKRPNEVRGLPILSQSLIQLSDLDRYMDAELVRKKAAALIGGFITQPIDGTNATNPFITTDDSQTEEPEIQIEALEPGTFPILPYGYSVAFSAPADVGPMFKEFLRQQLQMIAAAVNITYDQLTGDLSGENDRTLRAKLLEFKRIAMNYQNNILVHQFCRTVFSRWFDLAVLSGALKIPVGLDEEDARSVQWIADPWQYMNPQQEVKTWEMEVRAGFRSRSEVIIENGRVPEEVDAQIKQEREREKSMGLTYTTNPSVVSNAGLVQTTDPTALGTEAPEAPAEFQENEGEPDANEP